MFVEYIKAVAPCVANTLVKCSDYQVFGVHHICSSLLDQIVTISVCCGKVIGFLLEFIAGGKSLAIYINFWEILFPKYQELKKQNI